MLNTQTSLTALSPLDGRYNSQLTALANLFSEFGFFKHRVGIEVKYLIFLSENGCIPPLSRVQQKYILQLAEHFSLSDAEQVKELEQKTKHDVKAIEYFIQHKLTEMKIPLGQYVHLALTSEDVNSLAYSLMIQEAQKTVLVPELKKVLKQLSDFAAAHKKTPMLARTHGQPAVPTTVGKEVVVFAHRLLKEIQELNAVRIEAKLTGAVGNLNAHTVAFSEKNWLSLSGKFVESLGVQPNRFTTQTLPAESYSKLFSTLQRINTILLDFNQDVWRYISDNYFVQKAEEGQVGSSTMPQKINPIDFENSEGNLGLANSLLVFFVQKLPVSRLQRDLSDSTVKRSIGSAFGYSFLAYTSLQKGLRKFSVNTAKLAEDLDQHWEVLAEAFQVVLRVRGDKEGYEKLKLFSQGKQLTKQDITKFIDELTIPEKEKKKLRRLSPTTYIGLAEQLTQLAIDDINLYLKGAA